MKDFTNERHKSIVPVPFLTIYGALYGDPTMSHDWNTIGCDGD